MVVTIIAILMIMIGYFLILYSAVALIQDKRFYTSAPKEVQAQAAMLGSREHHLITRSMQMYGGCNRSIQSMQVKGGRT